MSIIEKIKHQKAYLSLFLQVDYVVSRWNGLVGELNKYYDLRLVIFIDLKFYLLY